MLNQSPHLRHALQQCNYKSLLLSANPIILDFSTGFFIIGLKNLVKIHNMSLNTLLITQLYFEFATVLLPTARKKEWRPATAGSSPPCGYLSTL